MVSNVGVDRSNVHEMVWWQEETHSVTGARKVFRSLFASQVFTKKEVHNILVNYSFPKRAHENDQLTHCPN